MLLASKHRHSISASTFQYRASSCPSFCKRLYLLVRSPASFQAISWTRLQVSCLADQNNAQREKDCNDLNLLYQSNAGAAVPYASEQQQHTLDHVKQLSEGLPIRDALPELVRALSHSSCAVLQAPPGAGKTTVVPIAASGVLAAGQRVLVSSIWLAPPFARQRLELCLACPPKTGLSQRLTIYSKATK